MSFQSIVIFLPPNTPNTDREDEKFSIEMKQHKKKMYLQSSTSILCVCVSVFAVVVYRV